MKGKAIIESSLTAVLGIFFLFMLLEITLRIFGGAVMSGQERSNRLAVERKGAYRIMCIGESTTADTPGLRPPVVSYPMQLGEMLNSLGISRGVSVINKGKPGINSSVIMEELEKNLDEYKPQMVVAMMGINDEAGSMPLSVDKTSAFRITRISKAAKLAELLWYDIMRKKKIDELLSEPAYLSSSSPSSPDGSGATGRAADLWGSAYSLLSQGKLDEAEGYFLKIAEKDSTDTWAYIRLGQDYRERGMNDRAERIFKKVIEGDFYRPTGDALKIMDRKIQVITVSLYLGDLYLSEGRSEEAEKMFRGIVPLRPDFAYKGLAEVYRKRGDDAKVREYLIKASAESFEYSNPVTRRNYRTLKDMLDARGIRLVCVQYPTRDPDMLKKVFEDNGNIIFVGNGQVFRDAVEKEGYGAYFVDKCYFDFGHCTNKGNALLAENVAKAILKSGALGSD